MVPSTRLRDGNNAATPELPSHKATKLDTSRGNSVPSESLLSTNNEFPPPPISSNTLGQKCKRANPNNANVGLGDEARPPGLGKGMTSLAHFIDQCNMFQGNVWQHWPLVLTPMVSSCLMNLIVTDGVPSSLMAQRSNAATSDGSPGDIQVKDIDEPQKVC